MVVVKHCKEHNWTYGPSHGQSGQFIQFASGNVYVLPRTISFKTSRTRLELSQKLMISYNRVGSGSHCYSFANELEFREVFATVLGIATETIGSSYIPIRRWSTLFDGDTTPIELEKSISWYLTPFDTLQDACNTLSALGGGRLRYDWIDYVEVD